MPDRQKILFDDDCKLCTWSTQIITDQDSDSPFQFIPIQSDLGEDILKDLGDEFDQLDSVILIEGSGFQVKSDAIFRITEQLPGSWSFLSLLSILPRPILDALYDLIARNRYRWFGKQASTSPLADKVIHS